MGRGYLRTVREQTPGNDHNTSVLDANPLYLPALGATPTITTILLERDDQLGSGNEPLPQIVEGKTVGWEFKVRAYAHTVAATLTYLFGTPTSVSADGTTTLDQEGVIIPVGGKRHRWTAPFGDGLIPPSFRGIFAYKDQGVFYELLGCAVASWAIDTPDNGGCTITVSGVGTVGRKVADPGHVPVVQSLANKPFTRAGLKVGSWLSGSGDWSGISLKVDAPISAEWDLGARSKFASKVEVAEGLVKVTGSSPTRNLKGADIDAQLAGETFAGGFGWMSDTEIAPGYGHKFTYSGTALQYTGGSPEELTNARRIGGSLDWLATSNGAASSTFEVVNDVTSYAFVPAT